VEKSKEDRKIIDMGGEGLKDGKKNSQEEGKKGFFLDRQPQHAMSEGWGKGGGRIRC